MFGKGLIKLVGYVIAGAIALAAGAELLSSVVKIVLAFRTGNPVPLIFVIIIAVPVLVVSSRIKANTPASMIANILSYLVTGFLVVVSFVIGIPYGLVIAIVLAGVCGAFCSILRDSTQFRKFISTSISHFQILESLNGLPKRLVPVGDGTTFALNSFNNVLMLKDGYRDKLIQLMRERPLLPISYTHYVGCDVLFITENNGHSKFDRIMKLLREYGIEIQAHTSPLLAEAIQMVPIIDARHGLSLDEYRMTRDEATITNLLGLSPPRLTIFPTPYGLCALIPDMEAPGLNIEPLKRGYEHEVLLNRNYLHLREVETQIESSS